MLGAASGAMLPRSASQQVVEATKSPKGKHSAVVARILFAPCTPLASCMHLVSSGMATIGIHVIDKAPVSGPWLTIAHT